MIEVVDHRRAAEERGAARRDGNTSGDRVLRVLVLDEVETIVEALGEEERKALVGARVAVEPSVGLLQRVEVTGPIGQPGPGHVVG